MEPEQAASPTLPPSSPRAWSGLSTATHVVLLVVLTAGVYANTLDVPFVLDDIWAIGKNPTIRTVSAWIDSAGWRDPRFVSFLTFAVDGSVHGGSLRGMHLTNAAIHVAAVLLLYGLVRTLFRSRPLAASRVAPHAALVALGAAALFAVHPLQTQAVTYLIQRMASLAGVLFLVVALAYACARLSTARSHSIAWHALGLVALIAGLYTKQNVAAAPVALLVLDLACLQGPALGRIAALAPYWATTATIAFARMDAGTQVAAIAAESRSLGSATGSSEYLLTQFRVVLEYLRMLVWPSGQNVDPAFPVMRSFWAPEVFGSFALLGGLGITGAWLLATSRRRDAAWRLVGAGILWWFAAHSVESSVIPISDVMVEHRVYVPAAGIFLSVSVLAALAHGPLVARAPRWRHAPFVALAGTVLALATAAHARNELWRDGARLWADAAAKAPGNPRTHANLGAHLLVQGNAPASIRAYQEALVADPGYAPAHFGLSEAYRAVGQVTLAERHRAEAFRLGAVHQLELGEGLMAAGAWQAATTELERGVRGAPFHARMRRALGLAYLGAGDTARAVDELRRAIALAPSDVEAQLALSRALRAAGRPEEADAAEALARTLAASRAPAD